MKISFGWWRGSHNKATIPVGFDESLPQGFIEGLQWPDDLVLEVLWLKDYVENDL